jgi:hypothetical protein
LEPETRPRFLLYVPSYADFVKWWFWYFIATGIKLHLWGSYVPVLFSLYNIHR